MAEIDEVQKNLKIILKKGDLYDLISSKKNVKSRSNMFIKANILFFSRILYGGVLVIDRVKSHFVPIQQVKNAQDKIRQELGINIDIVKSKHDWSFAHPIPEFQYHLSVLYENANLGTMEYCEHLHKILRFCELYEIDEIILNELDIYKIFSYVDLDKFKYELASDIFNNGFLNCDLDKGLLILTRAELLQLIHILEIVRIDKKFIKTLGNKIKNAEARKIIKEFFLNDNVARFKLNLTKYLNLYINSNNSCKDKKNGKLFETVILKDEYIKVIRHNSKGELISSEVTTLLDYLGVLNYQNLLAQSDIKSDMQELFLISALYLHLYQYKKVDIHSKKSVSFYDEIYQNFIMKNKKLANKSGRKKRISKNFQAIYFSFIPFIIMFFGKNACKLLNDYFLHEKFMIDSICSAYEYSYKLEEQLFGKLTNKISGLGKKLSNFTGDSSNDNDKNNEDKLVATIISSQNENMPTYFASNYASSATYDFGQMNYTLEDVAIPLYNEFQNIESLFSIEMEINKNDLNYSIIHQSLELKQLLYPVGDNYVLTSLSITDTADKSKKFVIDANRARICGNWITTDEMDLLLSMNQPTVTLSYGVCDISKNVFVTDLEKKESYTSLLPNEVKEAITTGLNLDSNATLEDIYSAIKSKEYSKTPIKDAGMTQKIKELDEKEFFETIASLDSTICNLAATLAVVSNDELIYTVGYLNCDGNEITTNEAHAWAMTKEGEIIDVTPFGTPDEKKEAQDIVFIILTWCIENNIPYYAIAVMITLILNKLLGKKVRLHLKIRKIEKLLTKPGIEKSYAQIKDVLYGGTNFPIKTEGADFVDKIKKELSGFSTEELQTIKKELQIAKRSKEKQSLNLAKELLNEVPFIRENSEELKRKLEKKESIHSSNFQNQ